MGAVLAVVAGLSAALDIGRDTAAAYSSAGDAIASRALLDLDTYQGQCYTWMEQVVHDALGVDIGNDYRQGYLDAGFVEVAAAHAGLGDIIQIDNDAGTTVNSEFPGLHTVIILQNLGGGTFTGVDANQEWDGIVRFRDSYDPAAQAARYPGGTYHIYHFPGAANPSASSSPRPAAVAPARPSFSAGNTARTNVPPPDPYLRLRDGAGLSSRVVTMLPDAADLAVIGAPVEADGYWWVPVEASAASGWVAAQFLVNTTPAAANQSTYTVAPGDTLNQIAARFGVSADAVASANGISDVDLIEAGAVLAIPSAVTAAAATPSPTTYTVVEGDTLSAIAGRFGVEMAALQSANAIDNPSLIVIGATLTIP